MRFGVKISVNSFYPKFYKYGGKINSKEKLTGKSLKKRNLWIENPLVLVYPGNGT